MRITIDGGQLTIDEIDIEEELEDVEESQFNLQEARLVSETLTSVGRVPAVQKARERVNEATREYRKMEHLLFKERSSILRWSLNEFRYAWRTKFDRVRKSLKRKLKSLKKVETLEVAKVLEGISLEAYINYDVEPHVGNNGTFGPLKHSFWTH
jgi:predicted S18 family serine protease